MLRLFKWIKRAGLAVLGLLVPAIAFFAFSPKDWHSNVTDKQWQTALQQTIEGLALLGGCLFGLGLIWERYLLKRADRQKNTRRD